MTNTQNLKSIANRTTDEQREIAKKGGIKSGESRRRKKQMRELAQMIGNFPPSKEIILKIKNIFPYFEEEDITNKVVLLAEQFEKAAKGDTRAFEVFRDTSGEKPSERMESLSDIRNTVVVTEKELEEAGKRLMEESS
jgi:hypothetical protein